MKRLENSGINGEGKWQNVKGETPGYSLVKIYTPLEK